MIPLRDEEARFKTRTPVITWLLIAANVAVFFLVSPTYIEFFGLEAGKLLAGEELFNLIAAMFLHGGFLHLLFNMLSLWIFGDNVEDDLGHFTYLVLYLLTGIAGNFAFAFFASNPEDIAVGASGAISGVMGAYLVLHPKNRILTLIPLGFFITTARISAPVFIGIWFLLQFLGFAAAEGAIAYSAHIAGFIAGIILAVILKR